MRAKRAREWGMPNYRHKWTPIQKSINVQHNRGLQKIVNAPADARANRRAAKNTVKSPAKLVKNRKNTPANKDKK